MSKDQDKSQKIVEEKVNKINDILTSRVQDSNWLTSMEFRVSREGIDGSAVTPPPGMEFNFSDSAVNVTGKDEKFSQQEAQIQTLLNEASNAASNAQDQTAKNVTDDVNKSNEVEKLSSEVSTLKKDVENSQSEAQEIQAKIDDAEHQKEVKDEQYKAVTQTKEESLQGLNPEQTDSSQQQPAEAQAAGEETPPIGETGSS